MTIKFTALFQQATAVSDPTRPVRRIGGWSESWYFAGSSITAAINQAFGNVPTSSGWCTYRAALLPTGAAIVGQRFQVVAPSGLTQSLNRNFPGSTGKEGDYPQGALLCKVPALGASNIRRMILRGIPDAQAFEGEYQEDGSFGTSINLFFYELQNWQFRGRDLSQPTVKILTISATGAFVTETPHALAPGVMVRVLRSRTVDGDLIGGRFQVATIGPGTNQGTLLNWGPEATAGGTMRIDATVFLNVDFNNISKGRLVTRRVGRPFIQFRGRRSRKTG